MEVYKIILIGLSITLIFCAIITKSIFIFMPNHPFWLPVFKDVISVLFFITGITITILTYYQAKKTFFQPMKNEVFKQQLDDLKSLMKIFAGKKETDLREQFGFDLLVRANTALLLDNYTLHMFGQHLFNSEKAPFNKEKCPSCIASEKVLMLDNSHIRDTTKQEHQKKPSPDQWTKQEINMILIPKEMSDMQASLETILESPFLPKDCAKLIEHFQEVCFKNIFLMRKILSECSCHLLDKYTSIDSLQNASITWVSNKYYGEFSSLKKEADIISDHIKNYLEVDNLYKK
ncbi:hypothetical protein [Anaerospora hongkongensis]|uniref:hypothetical protein n=1 Tax=Anaerospora hongkongensis TaxID=244830 RepID=UPI0028A219D9|nr:hypothetical protein [Anaerospora hongkongensis]